MKTDYLLRTCLLLRCGNGLMALTGRDPTTDPALGPELKIWSV